MAKEPKEYGYDYFHGESSNYPRNGYVDPYTRERVKLVGNFVIKRAGTNIRWLDVGCAYGILVNYAFSHGIDSYGIDISDYAIAEGKKLFPAIANRLHVGSCYNIMNIFEEHSFDVVSLIELLEHLDNPIKALIAASKALKCNGFLLISTPTKKFGWDMDSTHVSIKPLKIWVQVLRQLGFSVKAPYYFGGPEHSQFRLVRTMNRNRLLSEIYCRLKGKVKSRRITTYIFATKKLCSCQHGLAAK